MRVSTVSRRQLLDILLAIPGVASDTRASTDQQFEFEPNAEFGVVWDSGKDNSKVPSLIVVESSKQRDFFAWVNTFVPALRPFSAFFRVVDPEVANGLPLSGERLLDPKVASGLIGLIVAEADISPRRVRPLSPVDCLGTASFCLARTLVIGLPIRPQDVLAEWRLATEFFGKFTLPPEAIRSLWDVVYSLVAKPHRTKLTDEQETILICCRDILEDGEISPVNWRQLGLEIQELENLRTLMDGTREDRVVTLQRLLVTVVRHSKFSHNVKSFVIGYLTSLVAPGTIEHMDLISGVAEILPTAAMWYGLCAGLKGSDATYLYSGGVGRRVMRELTRSEVWTDAPTCDIAARELAVIMKGPRNILNLLGGSETYVSVEIVPGVTCPLRFSNYDQKSESGTKTVPTFEFQNLTSRLRDLSNRINEVLREVQKLSGPQPSGGESRNRIRR